MADIDTSATSVRYHADLLRSPPDVGGVAEDAAALLEALVRERDAALADIARIQAERAEFLAGVEVLTNVLKGERDEALAREAALREAARELVKARMSPPVQGYSLVPEAARKMLFYIDNTAAAAASRDAALIERGRREGIEEALQCVPGGSICDPQDVADAIRALATSADGGGQ